MLKLNYADYLLTTPDNAEAIAKRMTTEDECGWTYVAKHCPYGTGKSFVEIVDEDGFVIGKV